MDKPSAMKNLYFLLMPLAICILSCGNKGGDKPADAQQTMLIVKWNLQKQNAVVYVDGAKQSETDKSASDKTFAYIEFGNDSKFMAVSYYNSGGVGDHSLTDVIAVDTVKGTFTFSNTDFKLSAPALAGFDVGTFST